MPFLSSALHVSVPLTDYAVSYRPDMNGFMWSRLLPPKVVSKRSGIIRSIDKPNMLRKYDLRVGKGGRVQEVQFKVGANNTFNAIDYAVEAVSRVTEAWEADEVLQYEQNQVLAATYAMHINLEIITVRDTLRDPNVMTQNVILPPAAQWDNYNSGASNPIEDLMVAILAVYNATGHKPNLILMSGLAFDRMQRHPSMLGRGPVSNGGLAIVGVEGMEQILGLAPGTIQTTAMYYNAAPEGDGIPPLYRAMIGSDVIVAFVEQPSIQSQGLGCSFMFQGSSVGNDNLEVARDVEAPFLVFEFSDMGQKDPRGATIHRLVGGIDQKVTNPEAGYLIKNVVDGSNTARYGTYLGA